MPLRWAALGVGVGVVATAAVLTRSTNLAERLIRQGLGLPDRSVVAVDGVRVGLGTLALEGLRVDLDDGESVATADTLRARFRILPLARRHAAITSVRVVNPRIRAAPTSRWTAREPAPDSSGSPWTVAVDRAAVVGGDVTWSSGPESAIRVVALEARVSEVAVQSGIRLRLDSLAGEIRASPPSDPDAIRFLLAASLDNGMVTVDTLSVRAGNSSAGGRGVIPWPISGRNAEGLDLRIASDSVDLADVATWTVPPVEPSHLRVDLRLWSAETAHANADASIRLPGGFGLDLQATVAFHEPASATSSESPTRVEWTADVRDFDPSLLGGPAGRLAFTSTGDLRRGLVEAGVPTTWDGTAALEWMRSPLRTFVASPGRLDIDAEGGVVTAYLEGGLQPADSSFLQALEIEARGRIEPWLPIPAFAADGQFSLHTETLGAVPGTFAASGSGVELTDLEGDLRVDIGGPERDGHRVDARVAFHPVGGAGSWDMELDAHDGGMATGHGSLDVPRSTLVVDELLIQDLDAAALVGDTVSSTVEGTASGELRMTEGGGATGAFTFDLDTARYGRVSVPAGSGTVALGELLALDYRSERSGAVLDLSVEAALSGPLPSVTIQHARFDALDPFALFGVTDRAASLNGLLTGNYSGNRLDSGTGRLSLRLDSSSVAPVGRLAGTLDMDLLDGVALAQADLRIQETSSVSGTGSLRIADGRMAEVSVDGLQFRGIDPYPLLSRPSSTGHLNGRLTAAYGIDGTSAGERWGRATVELDPSTLNGVSATGTLAMALRGDELEADVALRTERGRVDGTTTGTLTPAGLRPRAGTFTFSLPDLGTWVGLPDSAHATGRAVLTDATGGGADPRLAFEVALTAGGYGALTLDSASARGTVDRARVSVDTLLASTNGADLGAGGTIALAAGNESSRPFRARLVVNDAQPFAPLLGLEVMTVGRGAMDVTVQGSGENLWLRTDVVVDALLADGTEVVGIQGTATAAIPGGRAVRSGQATLALREITTPGGITVRGSDAEVRFDGTELRIDAATQIDQDRMGEIQATVEPGSRGRTFDIERLEFSADEDRWAAASPFRISVVDGLTVTDVTLMAGNQVIELGGRMHAHETGGFRLTTRAFRLGTLIDLFGFPGIDGALDSDVTLTGSLTNPEWTAEADARLVSRSGERVRIDVQSTLRGQRLGIDLTAADARGGSTTVGGFLPLAIDLSGAGPALAEAPGSADLDIRADGFQLIWFDPLLDPDVVALRSGRLDGTASVTGRTSEPVLAGSLALSEMALSLPLLGTAYDQVGATFFLQNRVVRIDNGALTSANGTATVAGTVELASLGLGTFELDVALDDFDLTANELAQVRASGAGRIIGTTQRPRVEGSLEVVAADAYLQGESARSDVEPVELTAEDYRVLESTFGYRPPARSRSAGVWLERLSMDMTVAIRRNAWLRQRYNPELAIQLTGDLSVQKEYGQDPRVIGTIEPIPARSYVNQWGRRFQLESGEIVFSGPIMEPTFRLASTYEVPSRDNPGTSEVEIGLEVAGKPDSISLVLSSTPTMDNADIVSYIATGQPAARSLTAGEGVSATDVGVDIAASRLTSTFEGLAAEAIGLDVVEIRNQGFREAVLVAGRYVSPRLYLGFQQPVAFGGAELSIGSEQTGRVEVEYEAFRWLLLNLQGGSSDVAFYFRTRHGY